MFRPLKLPWRLFRSHIVGQLLLLVPVLLVLGFAARWHFARQMAQPGTDVGLLFEFTLITLLVLSLAAFTLVAFWKGAQMISPLTRVLRRAQVILQRQEQVPEVEEWVSEEPGEWSELEHALTHISDHYSKQWRKVQRSRRDRGVLLDALQEPVLGLDNERRVLFWNERFAAFCQAKGDIKGKPLYEVLRLPELNEAVDEAMLRGRVASRQFSWRSTGDSVVRHYELTVAPLKGDEPGFVFGVVADFHDISELKLAEQMRIDFVANVSHELRSPLTAVQGFARTIEEDARAGRSDGTAEHAAVITRNAQRLLSLVEDLLLLSSLDSGASLERCWVDTQQLSREVLASLSARMESKQLKIVTDFSASRVWGDVRRLEQVLTNLLDNAIKYVPAGRQVQLAWLPQAEAVRLSVRDEGEGIAPEHVPRLFERFYRADTARSRDSGGTGLGLAIVKHIVQRHGGQVSAQSQVGVGTEFHCDFPNPAQSKPELRS